MPIHFARGSMSGTLSPRASPSLLAAERLSSRAQLVQHAKAAVVPIDRGMHERGVLPLLLAAERLPPPLRS